MLISEKLFVSYRKDVSEHARRYTQGLLNPDIRKNVEDRAQAVPGGNVQNLQQFIGCSKWSYSEVMALVMMAQLFLLKVAKENEEDVPLLSAKDIMLLLAYFLPKKEPTVEEIEEQMYKLHDLRKKATLSAAKKIKENLKLKL